MIGFLIGAFLGNLLNPIVGVLSLIAAQFMNFRFSFLLAGLLGAFGHEVMKSALREVYFFSPAGFFAAFLAYSIWGALGTLIKQRLGKRRAA